jgi:hypothetical protein
VPPSTEMNGRAFFKETLTTGIEKHFSSFSPLQQMSQNYEEHDMNNLDINETQKIKSIINETELNVGGSTEIKNLNSIFNQNEIGNYQIGSSFEESSTRGLGIRPSGNQGGTHVAQGGSLTKNNKSKSYEFNKQFMEKRKKKTVGKKAAWENFRVQESKTTITKRIGEIKNQRVFSKKIDLGYLETSHYPPYIDPPKARQIL